MSTPSIETSLAPDVGGTQDRRTEAFVIGNEFDSSVAKNKASRFSGS